MFSFDSIGKQFKDRKGFVYTCVAFVPGVCAVFSAVNKGTLAARYPSGSYLAGPAPHEYDIVEALSETGGG